MADLQSAAKPLNLEENSRLAEAAAPETDNGTITDELASVIDAGHTSLSWRG